MQQPLRQAWPAPAEPRPIVLIGAGAVARSAHLPAYKRLGLHVSGVFDLRARAAQQLAKHFRIPTVHRTLPAAAEAGAAAGAVFDVAVPPDQLLPVVRELPLGAVVLLAQPLGRDLAEARRIAAACERRSITAAVNFPLRFSPNMLALRDALERGQLGQVRDVELRVVTHTPGRAWTALEGNDRAELLHHRIHDLDLVRALFGAPRRLWCWAGPEPELPKVADARCSIVLEHEGGVRCQISTNHQHAFGPRYQRSQLKVEGSAGAALARLGIHLAAPRGRPDSLELHRGRRGWERVRLLGSCFPRGFEGPMSNLQRFVAGEDPALLASLEDGLAAMALVEACYRSARTGGTRPPEV